MNRAEMSLVLAKAAAYDARTIGEADVIAWHDAIGELRYDDAIRAVTAWYREHRERIMPADILAQVREIRRERHRLMPHEGTLMEGVDPGNVDQWLAIHRARHAAWLDGDVTDMDGVRQIGADHPRVQRQIEAAR